MKKKEKYSLTAKERKAMRKAGFEPVDTRTPEEKEAEEKAAEAKRKKIRLIAVISLVVLLAAALIATAIALPVVMARRKYAYVGRPVAEISLDNGMTLTFEIFEDSCPVAATNFLYLARIGYFDGTIIFDSQNNWVRFGGFEDTASRSQRRNNEAFCDGVSDVPRDDDGDGAFTYRLKSDTSSDAKNLTRQAGVLSFMYGETATEFQVAAIDNAQTNRPGSSSSLSLTAVGRALDDETLMNIAAIAALSRLESSADGHTLHSYWRAPVTSSESVTLIRIQSVKLYNLSKAKWKHFNFTTYMETALNGSTAFTRKHS